MITTCQPVNKLFLFFFTLPPWCCGCRVFEQLFGFLLEAAILPGTARLPDLQRHLLEQLCVFTPGRSESRSDSPPIPGGSVTCLVLKADNCSDSPAGTPGSRPDPDQLQAASPASSQAAGP